MGSCCWFFFKVIVIIAKLGSLYQKSHWNIRKPQAVEILVLGKLLIDWFYFVKNLHSPREYFTHQETSSSDGKVQCTSANLALQSWPLSIEDFCHVTRLLMYCDMKSWFLRTFSNIHLFWQNISYTFTGQCYKNQTLATSLSMVVR